MIRLCKTCDGPTTWGYVCYYCVRTSVGGYLGGLASALAAWTVAKFLG